MKRKKENKKNKQSIVEWMIENAPATKTKVGAEKKILKQRLMKKYG